MKCIFFIFSIILLSFNAYAGDLSFKESKIVKNKSGYYLIEWFGGENKEVELQTSSDKSFEQFEVIYTGSNSSYFISGLKNGIYYFRVISLEDQNISNILTIDVKHYNIIFALTIFAMGCLVFIAIVIIIVRGDKHYGK